TSRPGTSLQLEIVESGPQIAFSCSVLRHSTGLSTLTTTDSASLATVSCSYAMPFSSQIAISSSEIGREASEIAVSPWQNRSKPPPVPDVATSTWTPGFSPMNSSAAASDRGATVLDPSISTEPDASVPVDSVSPESADSESSCDVSSDPVDAVSSPSSPHAVRPSTSTPATATARSQLLEITFTP